MPVVRGWLHESEALALRRWAFGKCCLELGCFEGLSTIHLASTAASVMAVDTFDGRGTPEQRDTYAAFLANTKELGNISHAVGEFSKVLPKLDRKFDLIFIDGSHDYESVAEDISLCERLLNPGGWLVFHDYDIEHPGVTRAVHDLIEAGAKFVAQANSLVALILDGDPPPPKKACVAVVCPTSDGWSIRESTVASIQCSERYSRVIFSRSSSLLPTNHNQLLCDALNARSTDGVTHMAMLHADVVPCWNWIDILMAEMADHDLDAISAVVPLKNGKGLTSTGVGSPRNQYAVRRISMKELYELPVTFTARDVPFREADSGLMVNTGCFLMKLDEPWVSGLHFRQYDELVLETSTGLYKPRAISEDWDFCRQMLYRGARIGATRAVPLYHQIPEFHNKGVWGSEAEDQDYVLGQQRVARLQEDKDVPEQLSASDVP